MCDFINILMNDMGLNVLEKVFCDLVEYYEVKVLVIFGDDLLKKNFLLIYVVGCVVVEVLCLFEMCWGEKGVLKVMLVGKGVIFDIGGFDIKLLLLMFLMKKDMGGVVNVLGLVLMIMDVYFKVDLCVFVLVVENFIFGNVFCFGDIYCSCKGFMV